MANTSGTPSNEDVYTKFIELFWRARREHIILGKEADESRPEHKKAMDYAAENGIEWGRLLLEVSLLSELGKNSEALEKLEGQWGVIPKEYLSYGLFVKGWVLIELKEYDQAIDVYQTVAEDEHFDDLGYVWNNMGITYYNKGDYDKAIECYEKALKFENYSRSASAWNNMGLAYGNKGDNAKAIECYEKALGCENYDTPWKAWHNMGLAYGDKGNYAKAIECYEKVLECENNDRPDYAWYNMGVAYWNKGDYAKAVEAFRKVLELTEAGSWIHAQAKRQLLLLEANLKPEAMSDDDRTLLTQTTAEVKDGPEQRLLAKISDKEETKYDEYLKVKDSKQNNVLSILRGWSSSVTLLDGSEMECRGGGYFIKWQGKGIVIDPGMDFLRNYHDAGYHAREIDAILISHNHPDHNSDLRNIDNLKYELYKKRHDKDCGSIGPYMLVWDADSKSKLKLQIESPEHRRHDIVFDVGRCRPLSIITKKVTQLPFKVEYFPVCHCKGELSDPVGFKLHLLTGEEVSVTIGYSGDTKYWDGLGEYLKGCDILLAHISQPSEKEFGDCDYFKDNHLGYNGLVRLIKAAEPKLTLVGEFWAGIGDFRIDIVKCLRERTECSNIMPAGIGLDIEIPDIKVKCIGCGKSVPFDEVRVGPAADDFGKLSYLCEDCCLF